MTKPPSDPDARPPGSTLRPVRVELYCPRGPELHWQVVGVRGREALSEAYAFELELACDDEGAELDAMLGADAELVFDRNGLTRVVYGVIAEFELGLAGPSLDDALGRRARARLVPAFALLDQELDTRFFVGQSVVEILGARLGEALAPFGRELDLSRLQRSYPRRDYCVQFGESTYAFCRRLLAEAGVGFWFEPDHEAQRERLVLVDDNASYEAVELLVAEGLAFASHEGELLDRESISRFDWRRRRRPNQVATRGYNFKLPARFDEGEAEVLDPHHHRVRAAYHHDDRRQIVDDPVDDPEARSFDGSAIDQRPAQAADLLARYRHEAARGLGASNAVGFGAGRSFVLAEAADATGGPDEFLLVRVEHEAALQDGGDHSYLNRFECCLRAAPFRPPPAGPKPRVQGVLTGVVVGPVHDEVHTDGLGRVKVQLHADRLAQRDEHASCWIRVAQMWAGPGYGALVIPRVGMEVVVSFVAGDPDQPLVTGCVYHGDHAPPAPLPEAHSQSVFKSSSTPGGDGFSELRVDDAAGREQIFVRAQRRMDLRVGGSLFETASGNREEVVGRAQDEEGQHNTLVHGERNLMLRGARYDHTRGELYVGANKRIARMGSDYLHSNGPAELNAPRRVVETSEYISHKSDTIELAGSWLLSVKGGKRVVLESNNKLELRVGLSSVVISPERIEIQSARVRINSGGKVGEARDGRNTAALDYVYPIEAYAADDGRPGSGGGGGGGGGRGRRRHATHELEPHRAPPMEPPPPVIPPRGQGRSNARAMDSLAWDEDQTWCSEPVDLTGMHERPGDSYLDTVRLIYGDSGELFAMQAADVGQSEGYRQAVAVTDVLPRSTATGLESERKIHASVGGTRTSDALSLRFLTALEPLRYDRGRSRFNIRIEDGEIVVGGTIEYVRGWLHYVILLGDHVPLLTGGRIRQRLNGSLNYRYCKKDEQAGAHGLVFWDGDAWVPVPDMWSSPLGTKLHGCAVWREGGQVHTQYGQRDWPDAVPEWSPAMLADKDRRLATFKRVIEDNWTGKVQLKRGDCLSNDPRCCRHPIRCEVNFVEVDALAPDGIVLAENDTRANASAWSISGTRLTAIHEFGHHLGNPDEYPGAGSVDVLVMGDGAVFGIDEESIMGGGREIRRRHYKFIAEALDELVRERLDKDFTYTIVDALP